MLDELQDPAFGFHARVLGDEVVAELRVLLVELRTANQLLVVCRQAAHQV